MKLFSPWAFWFLSLIPIVVIMYILKQRFEEKEVSSIKLWKQVLKDIEVNTPWQKLKKNILLFLQLLLIILLIFTLADPLLTKGGRAYTKLILVIDNSGSMNTKEDGVSRLELAKRQAEAEIKNSSKDTQVTIITVGNHSKIEVAGIVDKSSAISQLRAINSSKSTGSISDALSLVEALSKDTQAYKAVFYTDSDIMINNINGEVVNFSGENINVSLDYLSHSITDKGIRALLRVSNRSDKDLTREVSLFSGDRLLDVIKVELEPNKTNTVYFDEQIDFTNNIYAELTEQDVLTDDNIIYDVVKSTKPKKVLLVTKQNVFIEKALIPIKGIELYKSNPDEYTDEDFDLYIFDGNYPDKLPDTGNILLVNPPQDNSLVDVFEDIEGGVCDVKLHPVTKYMDNAYFVVSAIKSIEVPYWASVLINIGENPAVIVGEYKGRNVAVIAFDLHNTDFALTPEYPIFMHNLMEYLVNISINSNTKYFCGEAIPLSLYAETQKAQIIAPSGKVYEIGLKYPILPFEETIEQGIYKINQNVNGKASESVFAVNFPAEQEAGENIELLQNSDKASIEETVQTGRRIQIILLLMVILLVSIEWVVYTSAY